MPIHVFILGMAGCGKTSLTAKFTYWLRRNIGLKAIAVNLDSGAINLPYEAYIDVRKFFTLEELMLKEGLGPNGAMVYSMEILEKMTPNIVKALAEADYDIAVMDTPGQNEVFSFRPAGPRVVEAFTKLGPSVGVFLIDASTIVKPSDLVACFSVSIASQIRLRIPVIVALSKIDKALLNGLDRLLTDYKFLRLSVKNEVGEGLNKDFTLHLLRTYRNFMKIQKPVKTSALTEKGLEELYDTIHEALCECGDLT
ncbi:MAG: ATP/GTP-binding protein [Candidatus Bathyarchaeia archaeon]